jgi:DNA-binding transcriptional ArsR family regulator
MNDFIRLANATYKMLEFFPESDPLKHRAKDKALVIMEHLVLITEASGWTSFQNEKIKAELTEDIEILLGYLWIAKTQGWLNSANYLIVANEYGKIKSDLKPIVIEATQKLPFNRKSAEAVLKEIEPRQSPPADKLPVRQSKIIEFLSKNGKAQVMDLQTVLPDITKRTIRRDLDELLESGKVIRLGDFNQVFYKLSEIGQIGQDGTN